MRVTLQQPCDNSLFLLRVAVPDLPPARPQSYDQCAGLHCLLEAAKRILMPRDLLQLLIGTDINRISGRTDAQDMFLIILADRQPCDHQPGIVMDQHGSDKEGSGQPLEDLRPPLCVLLFRRVIQMRVGDLCLLAGHHQRAVYAVEVGEDPLQQIPARIDPARPGQTGKRT